MKTKILIATLVFAGRLAAAPLTETTAVHLAPDIVAPTITYLKAGTEPRAAASALATTPAGWMAVEIPGPLEGWVPPDGLTKNLDIRPGTQVRLTPKADGPVLTTMEAGDKAELLNVSGKWTQFRVEKPIIGYIRVQAPQGASLPPIATAPAGPSATSSLPTPAPAGGPGKAAPMVEGGLAGLPRIFEGKFVSTKRPFAPRRPFDYQINDESGVRVAYVDISKVARSEQIEKYLDRNVTVSGLARNVPEAKGIVIVADSLQIK